MIPSTTATKPSVVNLNRARTVHVPGWCCCPVSCAANRTAAAQAVCNVSKAPAPVSGAGACVARADCVLRAVEVHLLGWGLAMVSTIAFQVVVLCIIRRLVKASAQVHENVMSEVLLDAAER